MKNAFRQSMGWLHTWAGLVVAWVLFFIFLTGSAGYFDTEIDRWMQPERPLVQGSMTAQRAIAVSRERLEELAPDAERWFITFPSYRAPELRLFWQKHPGGDGKPGSSGVLKLDPDTGETLDYRKTGGGQLLYRMHWRLHYLPVRASEWIVGICTMFMLVGIVTGVIVHKRIFRDFFTYRPGKGQRSWLDMHNVLGVLALPFHVMITYSGLVFIAYLYMAPVISASYGVGDNAQDEFFEELLRRPDNEGRAGVKTELVPLSPIVAQAERRWGERNVRYLDILNPGDQNSRVIVGNEWQTPIRRPKTMIFDGGNGALLQANDGVYSAPLAVRDVMLGLHEGLFAGPILRWIYFLSGLMGTAMIGAGLVLWTTKRRAKSGDTVGFRLVERLNIGTIVGLPIAIAAYFWANRLIPVGIEGRAAWEAHAMFIFWAVMLAHAFIRPAHRGWVEQLWIAAGAFGLLPLLNALTTDKHLGATLPAGVWELAGFDLTVLVFGLAFTVTAWRISCRRRSDQGVGTKGWITARQETEAAE
ncbi:MAG: PepSY-associated TM helix domain-containing protein [Alphaproteobacteria bacterium]|nr:PepSY-associated TM helix domain-containing protein [Alphaproteobacteria bacterium]